MLFANFIRSRERSLGLTLISLLVVDSINFLCCRSFASCIHVCNILPCCFSDHDYVSLTLVLNSNFAPGPGLWKLNNSLLLDSQFFPLFQIVFLISPTVLRFFHLSRNGGTFSSAVYSLKLFPFLDKSVNPVSRACCFDESLNYAG